jgi:ABC-type sulfate/molybdate transport systems ATPase subunit
LSLLDEPLTALDAKLKEIILQQLRSLHHGFGVRMLYVTYDPAEAIEICEEVLMLESGKSSRAEARANFSPKFENSASPAEKNRGLFPGRYFATLNPRFGQSERGQMPLI